MTWCIGALLIAPAAVWSLLPLPVEPAAIPRAIAAASSKESQDTAPLDLSVFRARIWVPPPRAVAAKPEAAPAPPPAPLRLQLIGILSEPGAESDTATLRAALYDLDSDRLFIVGAGDTLGSHFVTQISVAGVVLTQGTAGGRTSQLLVHASDKVGGRP